MKKKTTPLLIEHIPEIINTKKTAKAPSREVIKFLQLFARNYHVNPELPEGINEIIMG